MARIGSSCCYYSSVATGEIELIIIIRLIAAKLEQLFVNHFFAEVWLIAVADPGVDY